MSGAQMVKELEVLGGNPGITPHLHVWGWEIPVYLFLGGMAAGFLVLSGLTVLLNRRQVWPYTAYRAPVLVLPLMGIGMGALFLDLAYRAHVFRFYTTFRPASPMSWGSWILLLVFPAAAATLIFNPSRNEARALGAMALGGLLSRARLAHRSVETPLALANVIVGAALGIYTGILLGALGARPLWSSAILGPLFLVSGLSAAAAVLHMIAPTSIERRAMARIDVAMLALELLFLGLLLLQLATGGQPGRDALALLVGGPYTAVFWVLVVFVGLLVPAVIQTLAVSGRIPHTSWGPTLVLIGGLALRFVIVYAGQMSEWRGY